MESLSILGVCPQTPVRNTGGSEMNCSVQNSEDIKSSD